jgi:hypothetical protein
MATKTIINRCGSLATTDATPTTVTACTVSLPTNSGANLCVEVVSREATSGAVRAYGKRRAVKRVGAGAVLCGADIAAYSDGDAGAGTPTVAFVVSTNDIVVQITGIAATNIDSLVRVTGVLYTP